MIDSTSTESDNNLDNISLVGDMVGFHGYSRFMKAGFSLFNSGTEDVFVTELPLEIFHTPESTCFPRQLVINRVIEPDCPTSINMLLSLSSDTLSGNYSGTLIIGEKRYKVKFEVYSRISLSISPNAVQYQGVSPGKKYEAVITLKNNGNVPYTIQQQNHSMMLDYDYLCKAAAVTVGGKGSIGFMGLLDGIVNNVQSKYAKLLALSVRQSGQKVNPGEEINLNISFTLPEDVDRGASYVGNIRIAGRALLSYEFFA